MGILGDNLRDLTRMMQDTSIVERDMNEAMEQIQLLFQKKYANKIKQAVHGHQNKTRQTPSREVLLLTALKPFLCESQQMPINQLIDVYMMANTAQSIGNELRQGGPWPMRSAGAGSADGREDLLGLLFLTLFQ